MSRSGRGLGLLLLLTVLSCGACQKHRAKVIPASALSEIYADMFMADQWIQQNSRARRTADTMALYRPILEKYGYTVEDYDASVAYYLHKPDKYSKILKNTSASLNARADRLQKIEDAIAKRPKFSPYTPTLFRYDTLVFKDDTTGFWPNDSSFVSEEDSIIVDCLVLQPDSLAVHVDSLAVAADSLQPASRPDSINTILPANREQVRDSLPIPLHRAALSRDLPVKIKD